jgi:hypothetical protein
MKLGLISTLRLTKIQLSASLVVIIYLTGLFFIQDKRFISNDKPPAIYAVDEKTKKLASIVHVGMYVNSFPVFSFDQGLFTIDATVWFRFAAASEALDTLEQFTLYNSLIQQNGKLTYRSDPIIKLIGDEVLVCYQIQTTFKLTINHKYFPIGDHTLHILLQNKGATVQELCFVSDSQSFSLSDDISISEWRLKNIRVKTGYAKSDLYFKDSAALISYPAVLFSVDFDNVGFRYGGALYLPMLIIFLIGLLSLLLGVDDSNRLTLITGSVPSLVLFRLVINAVSPIVGYITHVDFVFYAFVILLLIVLLFQIYVVLKLHRTQDFAKEIYDSVVKRLELVSDLVFSFVLVLLMILVTYSFYF